MNDRIIIYLASLLRALAIGLIGVLFAIYLAKIDYTPSAIGVIISLGLSGGALAALIVTFLGDYFGRKHSLIFIALLSAAGGFLIAYASNMFIVALAAFFGVLNGMGR